MAETVQDTGNSMTLSGYAGTRADRCQRMKRHRAIHNLQLDDENKELTMHEFDSVKSKVFNFLSIRSIEILKLKTKDSQNIDTY